MSTKRTVRGLAVLLGYLLVSLWVWQHVLAHPRSETVHGGQADPGLFIWWLRWDAYAVFHGRGFLYNRALNAPAGVSAMWNTSVLALGVPFAPLTERLGAVFTFNVLAILAPALSAWTGALWLRRHFAWPAALLGGLLFGFSPFVITQDGGHLHLAFLALVPVIAMLVEDVCRRSARPWRTSGPLLGLVAAVQLLISSEVLVITALAVAVVLVVAAAFNPRRAVERLRPASLGFVVAAVVAGALIVVPLVSQFSAGHAIKGPMQATDYYEGQPVDLIAAPPTVALHTSGSARIAEQLTSENGLYIGIPLLVALAGVIVVIGRKRKGVLVAAISALIFFVSSLGGRLRDPSGRGYHGPTLPWGYLERHVPLLQNVLPVRFAIPMWLAVAFIAAAGLDAALARWRGRAIVPVALVVVAGLVPLVPVPKPAGVRVVATPRFFTSDDLHTIRRHSVVLLAPIPDAYFDNGMLWQVQSGMWFAQVGGYGLRPAGVHRRNRSADGPPILHALLGVGPGGSIFHGRLPPETRNRALAALRQTSATAIVVGASAYSTRVIATVEQLLGRAPDLRRDGVTLWYLPRRSEPVEPVS